MLLLIQRLTAQNIVFMCSPVPPACASLLRSGDGLILTPQHEVHSTSRGTSLMHHTQAADDLGFHNWKLLDTMHSYNPGIVQTLSHVQSQAAILIGMCSQSFCSHGCRHMAGHPSQGHQVKGLSNCCSLHGCFLTALATSFECRVTKEKYEVALGIHPGHTAALHMCLP